MDHVTRQLIVLAKELRDDFRQTREALSNEVKKISQVLQQTSDAKHAEQERAAQNEHARQAVASVSEEATERKKHAEHERDYGVQNSIRHAAWGAFIAASIYGGIAILQWCEMRKTTKAAVDTAITASKEMELSQRPWVSIEGVAPVSPLTFDSNGATVTIGFTIKNSGHSPAIRGFYQQRFFSQFINVPNVVKERDKMCEEAGGESTLVQNSKVSETWFPGDPVPMRMIINLSKTEIQKGLVDIPHQLFPDSPPKINDIVPAFAICIAYRSTFTETQYHTGYVFELLQSAPRQGGIVPLESGEIPANRIRFYYHPFYGIYAD